MSWIDFNVKFSSPPPVTTTHKIWIWTCWDSINAVSGYLCFEQTFVFLLDMGLLGPEQVYSLHELLLSAYRILQLPLLINQVLLHSTQLQLQPVLFLDRRRDMLKVYKPQTFHTVKRDNWYFHKSRDNDSIVQLLGLNVMDGDHKWWTGKGKMVNVKSSTSLLHH